MEEVSIGELLISSRGLRPPYDPPPGSAKVFYIYHKDIFIIFPFGEPKKIFLGMSQRYIHYIVLLDNIKIQVGGVRKGNRRFPYKGGGPSPP